MSATIAPPPAWVVSTTDPDVRRRYMDRGYYRAEAQRERELGYQRGRDDARSYDSRSYDAGYSDGYYDTARDRAPRAYDVAGPVIAASAALTTVAVVSNTAVPPGHDDLAPRAYDVMPSHAPDTAQRSPGLDTPHTQPDPAHTAELSQHHDLGLE